MWKHLDHWISLSKWQKEDYWISLSKWHPELRGRQLFLSLMLVNHSISHCSNGFPCSWHSAGPQRGCAHPLTHIWLSTLWILFHFLFSYNSFPPCTSLYLHLLLPCMLTQNPLASHSDEFPLPRSLLKTSHRSSPAPCTVPQPGPLRVCSHYISLLCCHSHISHFLGMKHPLLLPLRKGTPNCQCCCTLPALCWRQLLAKATQSCLCSGLVLDRLAAPEVTTEVTHTSLCACIVGQPSGIT